MVVAELAGGSQNAVAGDQKGDSVARNRAAHGTRGTWPAQQARQLLVAEQTSERDPQQRAPHLDLKIGATDPERQSAVTGRRRKYPGQCLTAGDRVVLETERPGAVQEGATGRVLSREEETNRVRAKVNATGPMLVALTDRFYPGWRATVNGRRAEVLRANGVFRAVEVPAGVSDVEFRFLPGSLLLGALVSLVGLVLLGVLWGMARSRAL